MLPPPRQFLILDGDPAIGKGGSLRDSGVVARVVGTISEALDELRQAGVLTSSALREDFDRAMNLGADSYFLKPMALDKLRRPGGAISTRGSIPDLAAAT